MKAKGPFHEGELEAQRLAGESEAAMRNAPMIGNRIMAGAVGFVTEQPMAIFGSRDRDGRLWSSIVFGQPGFLRPAVDRRSLTIYAHQAFRDKNDPLWQNLADHSQVGILVIDLSTCSRLRINGRVASLTPDTMLIAVEESFANCPKYIQRREIEVPGTVERPTAPANEQRGRRFGLGDFDLIRRADTFFVTSAHPERGLDSSHRGGNPGFVEVVDESTLRIPDYMGNSMFNTIGNLLVDPRAGLIFPDFSRHDVLQMTGRVEVHWGQPEGTDGTSRSWVFHLDELRRGAIPAEIRARLIEYSPYNPTVR